MSVLEKLQQEGRAEIMQEGSAQVMEALLGKGFSQAKLNEFLPSEFL